MRYTTTYKSTLLFTKYFKCFEIAPWGNCSIYVNILECDWFHYVTPLSERVCVYCDSGECDTEQHAILSCETFSLKRQCFLGRVTALCPAFLSLTAEQQLSTLLCPATTALAKCVSKFLGIISETRKEIDLGLSPQALQVYQRHRIQLITNSKE